MNSDPKQKSFALNTCVVFILLLIVSLSVVCRYQWLPGYPYHEDGAATIEYIESIAAGHVSFEQLFSQRSPLGHSLLALPLFFVDSSAYSYRLTNLFFFAGVLLLLVLIGRQTGHFWAGAVAMLFVGFSSLEGLFVSFVRFYLVFQFFFLLAWYLLNAYSFSRKKYAGLMLCLVIFLSIFVHKLSLQLFFLGALALLLSGFWACKRKMFWLCTAMLVGCVWSVHFGSSLTLAPSDFNELIIGNVGSLFKAGRTTAFFHTMNVYFPLGWVFILWGFVLSVCRRDRLLSHYYVGFLTLFFVTSLLAPGDSPHYISHLFPVGVLCGMTGLSLALKDLFQSIVERNKVRMAVVLCPLPLIVLLLGGVGLDNYRQFDVFGRGVTFLDQRAPHEELRRHVHKEDTIISTEPGLTRIYLKNSAVLSLRQQLETGGTGTGFRGYEDDANLIDSVEKLDALMNKSEGWVWLYGNKKYQFTVGSEMRAVIDKLVKKVVYYDAEKNIFIVGLKKS